MNDTDFKIIARYLNGVSNLLMLLGLIGLTVAAVIGSFQQGWNLPQIIAANSVLVIAWSLLVYVVAKTAREIH